MMKQRMPQMQAAPPQRPRSELKRTGETADHNGYPCVKYLVVQDGRTIRELWVTDWDHVEGGEEVVEVFKEMAEFFEEFLAAIPNMGLGGGPNIDDNMFEYMNQLDGFPVLTREFSAGGSVTGESKLRSAERRTLDPADFEPPSGYKRRSMLPR